MNKNKETFYITTSIPYVNATPHIGTMLDSVYADVFARFKRQRGYDVRFLTGTDEHGMKIARSAEAQRKTPREFVDEISVSFRGLRELLNLSWDDFIRTSDRVRHFPGARKVWQLMAEKGDLYEKEYEGLYCVGCETFITEKELIDGLCPHHQKAPELVKEKNWFFKLSKYSNQIGTLIENNTLRVVPESRKNEILALIRGGLEDVSFSRPSKDLSWGVPVPGDEAQTMYVWCDALTNYISALGYGSADDTQFKKYWPADIHMIGKDNLRFHAGIWPGMLLSCGIALPKAIYVHGFVNVDGKKMSKSVGNVIDPYGLVKQYGVDPVRYYFLREFSPTDDGDFSHEKFCGRYEADLASGLGNFAARVSTLASKLDFANSNVVEIKEKDINAEIARTQKTVDDAVERFHFHDATKAIMELVSFGDRYINTHEPWKKSPDDARASVINAVILLDAVAGLLLPFLPTTSENITKHISWEKGILSVTKCETLFPRLS